MDSEFAAAIRSISEQPCAECGEPLGDSWAERYNPDTERLDKVHLHH